MKMTGIDLHKKVLMVVVIETTSPEEKLEQRRFTTLPGDLSRLSSWLRAQDVQEAAIRRRSGRSPNGSAGRFGRSCTRGFDLSRKAANLMLKLRKNVPEC